MHLLPLLISLQALAAEPGAAGFGARGFTISDASGDNALNLGLSFQPRYTATLSGDPEATDADGLTEAGFRIRRMLLTANGTLAGRVSYRFRIDAAKSFSFYDADGKSQQTTKPLLDDAQVVLKIAEPFQLSLGQWKVPFTASQMTSDTSLLFPDRPLPLDGAKYGDLKLSGFSWSRDVGLAALGNVADKRVEYQLGVFSGDGSNGWPPSDDGALIVARAAVAPLGELKYDEVDFGRGEPKLAVGLGVSLDSTPTYDDQGGAAGSDRELRAGGELRFQAAGLSLVAEALYGRVTLPDGSDPTQTLGAYAVLGYYLPVGVAPALRFARLDPSIETEDDGLTHIEGAVNLYLPDPDKKGATLQHKAQLQLAWTTALQDGLDHPLYHQGQAAVAVGF